MPNNQVDKRSELVFGLVGPTGVNMTSFKDKIVKRLKQYDYRSYEYMMSAYLRDYQLYDKDGRLITIQKDYTNGYQRVSDLQAAGNALRRQMKRGDALVLRAITEISRRRPTEASVGRPLDCHAHILCSLKHPDEVYTLRKTYGQAFFLIGVYSSKQARMTHLVDEDGFSEEEAEKAISRDAFESDPLGQRTTQTFELADVYVKGDEGAESKEDTLWRFLDLVFSNTEHTPTADERAMFLAYGAGLRSGSLARQVGACLISKAGDLLGVGANDNPCFGGGQYEPGSGDNRDAKRGEDPNHVALENIAGSLAAEVMQDEGKAEDIHKHLRAAGITEFQRDVHAEMECILSCARSGIPVRGCTLYSTTYPCHLCAKHIVGAGITRVTYIEAYPKSRADTLFPDSITNEEPVEGKVLFEPFIGIGPSRFIDMFSLSLGVAERLERKEKTGKKKKFVRKQATPKHPMRVFSALQTEDLYVKVYNEANGGTDGTTE